MPLESGIFFVKEIFMKYFFLLFIITPISLFSQESNYISNKDYTEFVTYVRDSLLRRTMGEEIDEEYYLNNCYTCDESYVPSISWKAKLNLNWGESREALEPFYYEPSERLNRKREFDTRKFILNGVKIYPDELVWCRDSTINKSWAIFLTKYYYTHPYFEDYPVQGVSNKQIKEYVKWKYPKIEKSVDISAGYKINFEFSNEKLHLTNRDYFEFYSHVRDSIARMILCQEIDEVKYCKSVNKFSEEISPPIVKWKHKIKWNDEAIYSTLIDFKLMVSDFEIDNKRVNFTYSTIDFYKGVSLEESTKRNKYILFETVNIWSSNHLEEISSVYLRGVSDKKALFLYDNFNIEQLRAFYHWKKSKYPKKDVFEGFIPHKSDLELLRLGELTDDFYSLKKSISSIQIK